MTDSMTCPRCKTRFVADSKSFGQSVPVLPQTSPQAPTPRQLPSLPTHIQTSQTGQRVAQVCISCIAVAAAWWYPNVITVTGGVVWFVSLVGGSGNWGVIHRFLDRNHDGKLSRADWGFEEDEPTEAPPPDILVSVAIGDTVKRSRITGTTEEQWQKAAWIMASVTCKDGKFSRDRVGAVFGDNKEFGRVQREMRAAGLLKGANRYTGYKLTPAGRAFLAEYRPSPTPAE